MRHIGPLAAAVLILGLLGTARLLSFGADAFGALHTSTPAPSRYAVILVVDGTRYDQFDLAHMPNLAALAAHGTTFTAATVGQLPSITETSHATIGTGVYPKRHGVLGDSWRDPGTSTMTPSLLNANLIRTGYLEKLIQAAHVPSLAGIIHSRYKGSAVVSLSGHKTYAASAMSAGYANYVAFGVSGKGGHFVPGGIPGRMPAQSILSSKALDLPSYPRKAGLEDSWATTLAIKMLHKYRPRLMMVNFPEPDNAGHTAGPDPAVIGPIMRSFDKDLGRLIAAYRNAGILDQTDFVITSDHGMVGESYSVDSSTIASVIRKAGGDPLYVGHGDYSPIWLKNRGQTLQAAKGLARAAIPHVAAVFRKTAGGYYALTSSPGLLRVPAVRATYRNLLYSFTRSESPDIVLFYDENTITSTTLFRKVGRKGDHEGANWGSQHVALFLSGPGIRQDYTSQYPARLVDIAPTVETLLGATPAGQDGVALANAMTDPPPDAAAAQAKLAPRRSQWVDALEQEATRTLAADTRP